MSHIRSDKKTSIVLVSIILLTLSFRVVDIDKPYETWDEVTTYSIGLNLWYNIFRGDFSAETWKTYWPDWSGSLHPPLVRYTYGIVNGIYLFSQVGPTLFSSSYNDAVYSMYLHKTLVPGRFLSALFAAGISVLIFLIARKYFGFNVAALSALLFALLPVSIAQTKIAALDAMLAFMYTITIYFFIRGLESRKYFYLSLFFAGLSIATKYNSVTLFALLPLIYFAYRRPKAIGKKHLLLIPVVSAAVLFLIWPRFWPDPIGGAIANINGWLAMGGGNVGEYFLGQFSVGHPAYYEITYVLATTPVLLLVFLAIGLAMLLRKNDFGGRMTLLWFLVPLVIYSLYQFKMSGPRYVFMIYPALSIIMGFGLSVFADKLKGFCPSKEKLAYYGTLGVVLLYIITTNMSVHPFYLDYYNEIVGGAKGAYENRLFDVGRWGEGIGAAAYWVSGNAEENSTVQFFVMPRHAIPPIRNDIRDLTPFIPKYISGTDNINWDMTNVSAEADYVVENTFFRVYMNQSFHELLSSGYMPVKKIEVQGAPLAWIYRKT